MKFTPGIKPLPGNPLVSRTFTSRQIPKTITSPSAFDSIPPTIREAFCINVSNTDERNIIRKDQTYKPLTYILKNDKKFSDKEKLLFTQYIDHYNQELFTHYRDIEKGTFLTKPSGPIYKTEIDMEKEMRILQQRRKGENTEDVLASKKRKSSQLRLSYPSLEGEGLAFGFHCTDISLYNST